MDSRPNYEKQNFLKFNKETQETISMALDTPCVFLRETYRFNGDIRTRGWHTHHTGSWKQPPTGRRAHRRRWPPEQRTKPRERPRGRRKGEMDRKPIGNNPQPHRCEKGPSTGEETPHTLRWPLPRETWVRIAVPSGGQERGGGPYL